MTFNFSDSGPRENAMNLPRRKFLELAGGLVTLPVVSPLARGQAYPTRPIALVAPIAAGGAVDTAARIIAEELQHKLQQSIVVENRPGAGTIIGTNFVAKAAPDGYTLLLMQLASVLAKWLNKTVPFDVTSDFSAIAMVADSPLVLFAQSSLAFQDLKELILEVVTRVASAIRESAELPDVQTRMSTLGFNLDFRTSDQFHELIIGDYQKFGAIIREAGIQPE